MEKDYVFRMWTKSATTLKQHTNFKIQTTTKTMWTPKLKLNIKKSCIEKNHKINEVAGKIADIKITDKALLYDDK